MNAGNKSTMTSTPGDLTMRVLYLKGAQPDGDRGVLQQLLAVAPRLELMTVSTPAEALIEVRRMLGWQLLLISPSVGAEDTLALIGSLRRDRVPIAAVPILDETNQRLVADAVTAGADAILLVREHTLIAVAETLTRLNHSPRLGPERFRQRLRVLYIGADPTVWNLLDELSFVEPIRLDPDRDPVMSRLSAAADDPLQYEVAVIDDEHGDPLPSEVLAAVKSQAPEASAIVLSSPAAFAAAPRSMAPGADVTFSKTGPFQQPLAETLRRLHDGLEVTRREAETRAREERLREIVDLVPAAILVIATDGPVLAMNTEGLRLFGATSARQVVGRDLRSFLIEADRGAMTSLLRHVAMPETSSLHATVETVDNRHIVVAFKAARLPREAGAHGGIVVTASALSEARLGLGETRDERLIADEVRRQERRLEALSNELAGLEAARSAEHAAHDELVRALKAEHATTTTELRAALEAERKVAEDVQAAIEAERNESRSLRAAARATWEAERDELRRALSDLRARADASESLQTAIDSLRGELRETDAVHARERASWSARIAELEARLAAERSRAAADRDGWNDTRLGLEGQLAGQAEAQASLERSAVELDALRQAHARQAEALTAERLAREVVRDEAETLRTLLEQELKKRSDAERRQGLLQEAYSHATGDRDRLIAANLFGYAVMTQHGEVVRCNEAFARLFGYASVQELLAVTAGRPFPMLAGRLALDARLKDDGRLARVESTLDRLDGQPVNVIESAALLSDTLDGAPLIERLFVRQPEGATADRVRVERLAEVGSLSVAMTPGIEALATALLQGVQGLPSATANSQRESLAGLADELQSLVRQLSSYGRRQTAAIELVSLDEVIRQAQPLLSRLFGEFVEVDLRLQSDALVLASRHDLDELVVALAAFARSALSVGGRVVVETGNQLPASAGGTTLRMTISGYGVESPAQTAAVSQAAQRCHASLHVQLPPGSGVRIDVVFAKTSESDPGGSHAGADPR